MKHFAESLKALCPNSDFLVIGSDALENVKWQKLSDPIPTQEQLEKKSQELSEIYGKTICKRTAKKLIASTDWAVLPDVGLANLADFEAYRASLRELIKNPTPDPVWVTPPEPVWK